MHEVIKKGPFDLKKSVEPPEIKMLVSVKMEPFLVGAQPAKKTQIDVIIVAMNIGVGMVHRIMLVVPYIGTAAHHIQRQGHQVVDQPASRVSAVVAIMLDVESNGSRGKGE